MNKLIAVGRFGRSPHFFIRCATLTKTDIFHHGIVEQHHILKHHRIIPQQYLWVYGRNIHTTYTNHSFGNVPQPCSKPGTGAFAGTGRAYQCRNFALFSSKAYIMQDFFLIIGKAHMLKDNIMPLWLKFLRALRCRRVINFIHTVSRHLRNKHFCNECQALVEWGIDTSNDQ